MGMGFRVIRFSGDRQGRPTPEKILARQLAGNLRNRISMRLLLLLEEFRLDDVDELLLAVNAHFLVKIIRMRPYRAGSNVENRMNVLPITPAGQQQEYLALTRRKTISFGEAIAHPFPFPHDRPKRIVVLSRLRILEQLGFGTKERQDADADQKNGNQKKQYGPNRGSMTNCTTEPTSHPRALPTISAVRDSQLNRSYVLLNSWSPFPESA